VAACHWWPRFQANLLPPACWEAVLPSQWPSPAVPNGALTWKETGSVRVICQVYNYVPWKIVTPPFFSLPPSIPLFPPPFPSLPLSSLLLFILPHTLHHRLSFGDNLQQRGWGQIPYHLPTEPPQEALHWATRCCKIPRIFEDPFHWYHASPVPDPPICDSGNTCLHCRLGRVCVLCGNVYTRAYICRPYLARIKRSTHFFFLDRKWTC